MSVTTPGHCFLETLICVPGASVAWEFRQLRRTAYMDRDFPFMQPLTAKQRYRSIQDCLRNYLTAGGVD